MLDRRESELRERMDDPHCDPERLRNTYAQFEVVNRWVTGWRRAYERLLRPRLRHGSTLLDVGCGGGYLSRSLARWSSRAGVPLKVTGIDPDPRALDFAARHTVPGEVEYLRTTAEELADAGRRFDFVVSNHLLHHLNEEELPAFLNSTAALAQRSVVHNDLRRHPAALLAFALTRPLFRRSYIVEDGLRSIRRSYTAVELRDRLPAGWQLEVLVPFRNLLVLER